MGAQAYHHRRHRPDSVRRLHGSRRRNWWSKFRRRVLLACSTIGRVARRLPAPQRPAVTWIGKGGDHVTLAVPVQAKLFAPQWRQAARHRRSADRGASARQGRRDRLGLPRLAQPRQGCRWLPFPGGISGKFSISGGGGFTLDGLDSPSAEIEDRGDRALSKAYGKVDDLKDGTSPVSGDADFSQITAHQGQVRDRGLRLHQGEGCGLTSSRSVSRALAAADFGRRGVAQRPASRSGGHGRCPYRAQRGSQDRDRRFPATVYLHSNSQAAGYRDRRIRTDSPGGLRYLSDLDKSVSRGLCPRHHVRQPANR